MLFQCLILNSNLNILRVFSLHILSSMGRLPDPLLQIVKLFDDFYKLGDMV